MKAAVVYGQNDIRIADVPVPAPGPGEMLIKVRASGVCATDVKILGGSGLPAKLPTILGHEVHRLGIRHRRRNHQIALVLAALVVDQNEHSALAGVVQNLLDIGQILVRHRPPSPRISRAT